MRKWKLWAVLFLLVWWATMAARTLTFTPGPSVARLAETETVMAGNPGFAHYFSQSPRPYYVFHLQVGPLIKHEAESLSALHAFHQGHKSFFWNGGGYRSVDDYQLVGEGDGTRKDFQLANRYIQASSFAVRTLRPSTGATSIWTTWSLHPNPGLVIMTTAPVSGDHVQAKYACQYRVNFAPDGLRLDQVAKDLYIAEFDLIENPVVTPELPVQDRPPVLHLIQMDIDAVMNGAANITWTASVAGGSFTQHFKALAATARFVAVNTPSETHVARGRLAVSSGATTATITTSLVNSAFINLVPWWNTQWRVTSRSSTQVNVAFSTQATSGGSFIDWGGWR